MAARSYHRCTAKEASVGSQAGFMRVYNWKGWLAAGVTVAVEASKVSPSRSMQVCSRGGTAVGNPQTSALTVSVSQLSAHLAVQCYYASSKTWDLDPSHNYIFGFHPHGVLVAGAFGNFCTNHSDFEELFPGFTAYLHGIEIHSADPDFTVWIKKCQEAQNGSQSEVSDSRTHQSKIKYDWYQTESQVIITLMIKNVQKNNVNVEFSEKELSALVKLPSGEDYNLKLRLLHPIIPEQSTFKVLSTKIEIKMKKTEAVRWEKLEGQGDVPKPKQFIADVKNLYPSSSHYTRNWDKLVGEIKEEEKNEKLEVDAALNKLFQQIYSDGSDEVKRAMNKSFMESGGTVLSINWSDVGKRKVEINPPDDMDWKKY
ncbi:LOW QUALITY PROTEIN: protein SGT1 homolog [Lycaon pictus]